MKKLFHIVLVYGNIAITHAQNYISGPQAVYGNQYNAATTVAFGGSILVGNGGNWFFGGKISSADKGNPNSPTLEGRTERITFSGNATFTGAALVDGYVSTNNTTAAFTMPIGNQTTTFPITVQAGTTVTAAYFDGLGIAKSTPVSGSPATIYSPYIDLPDGLITGNYTFSYPAGFNNSQPSILLNGDGSIYSLLSSVSTFKSTTGTTSANLTALGATQLYFGSRNVVLPITLSSFTGLASGCTAHLSWQTASEINSSHYAIESSSDGNYFTEVAKVSSKNNLFGAAYNYVSKLNNSISYFRLKAVDNDGSFTYSHIISVYGTGACNASLIVNVSPNPTSDIVNIQGLIIGSHITLINTSGEKLITVIANGNVQSINLASYIKGIYFLLIQNLDGTTNNIKVVKK